MKHKRTLGTPRLLGIVWPFIAVVLFQALLGGVSLYVLSAVRGYVAGESLWSKGQKDAIYYLNLYADSRDEGTFLKYQNAIAVPQGGHELRIALDRPNPDLAAARLGIAHYVLDYESRFRDQVIDDFVDSYARGETPIPCIQCNRSVKFRDLLDTAKDLGADVKLVERPGTITREDARRRLAILINVRGRDTEGFVREAEARLKAEVKPVGGVYWEFGGQFENLQRASARLALIVPIVFLTIGLLLGAGPRGERRLLMLRDPGAAALLQGEG